MRDRVQSAATMKETMKKMEGVTRSLQAAMKSVDLEKTMKVIGLNRLGATPLLRVPSLLINHWVRQTRFY